MFGEVSPIPMLLCRHLVTLQIEKSINSAKIELLSTLSNWDPDILVQRQHGTEGGGAKWEAGRGVARQEVGGGRAKGDPAGGGGAKRHRSQEL